MDSTLNLTPDSLSIKEFVNEVVDNEADQQIGVNGWIDSRSNIPQYCNPYKIGSKEWERWLNGYNLHQTVINQQI